MAHAGSVVGPALLARAVYEADYATVSNGRERNGQIDGHKVIYFSVQTLWQSALFIRSMTASRSCPLWTMHLHIPIACSNDEHEDEELGNEAQTLISRISEHREALRLCLHDGRLLRCCHAFSIFVQRFGRLGGAIVTYTTPHVSTIPPLCQT